MNWSVIIGDAVTTAGAVLVAYLAFRGKLVEFGKQVKKSNETAEKAASTAHKIEQSINNRPTSVSDRLDDLASGQEAVHAEVKKLGYTLDEHGRDIRGLRSDHKLTRRDIGQLRGEDRAGREETQQLREEFAEHVRRTDPMMPMLEGLYTQYVDERHKPHE